MQRLQHTPEAKAEALRLLAAVGKAEAARLTGIPVGTISSWGVRNGVSAPHSTAPQLVASQLSLQERKLALADDMLDRARSMIKQLDATMVEKKALVVSDGRNEGSHVEIAEVDYDRPPTGAQKQIVETVAILIGQVQLLTGAATTRLEQNVTTQGEVVQVRERAVEVLDELSVRRSA